MSSQSDEKTPPSFAPEDVPVIFFDIVANLATGPGILRAYLVRHDPAVGGSNPTATRPSFVAQLVMSTTGFASMAILFQQALENMIKRGEISDEIVKDMRRRFGE